MKTFAKGGIATSPSIFGEAGSEMAIPLKKNNTRSQQLIKQADSIVNGNKKSNGGINVNLYIDTFLGEEGYAKKIADIINYNVNKELTNMA